jgi:hypothetical protein
MSNSFANSDLRLQIDQIPVNCPDCGNVLTIGKYFAECENWPDCQYCVEIINLNE